MNRKEREALCELLEHMSRLVNDPAQKTMVQAVAEIRRLADELEWIKDYESRWPQSLEVSDLKERARRALDGDDE